MKIPKVVWNGTSQPEEKRIGSTGIQLPRAVWNSTPQSANPTDKKIELPRVAWQSTPQEQPDKVSTLREIKLPQVAWDSVPQSGLSDRKIQLPASRWESGVQDQHAAEKPITIPQNTWAPLPGVRNPIPLRQFTGVSGMDPYSLADSFASYMENITVGSYPAMSVRQGSTIMGAALTGPILGLDNYKDTELHTIANGVWYRWSGTAWVSILTGLNTTKPWYFCNFKGNFATMNLIATNGVDAARRWDGTSVVLLAGAPAGANFVDQHDNHVYFAIGNKLYVSATNAAEDYTTPKDSQQFNIHNENGEDINGIRAGAGHVVVFTRSSIHELWGTSYKDYKMQVVAEDIGLINNRCVVNLGGVLYFANTQGIYRYGGGTLPDRNWSQAIDTFWSTVNLDALDQCSMGSDGNNLFVSFPSGGVSFPNTILEYDPRFGGLWTMWKDYAPKVFARMKDDFFIGDTYGSVYKMGGATDNGQPITWEWISKAFTADSIAQNVNWYRLWVVADIPSGSSMTVSLSKSAAGSDWVLVKSLTSADAQTGRIMIPMDAIAGAHYMRVRIAGTGPVTIHELDRQQRELPLT